MHMILYWIVWELEESNFKSGVGAVRWTIDPCFAQVVQVSSSLPSDTMTAERVIGFGEFGKWMKGFLLLPDHISSVMQNCIEPER